MYGDAIKEITLTPAAVATITSAEQTFTMQGLQVNDVILSVTKPTTQAGLGIVGFRVVSANTIGITWMNPTVGSITPTAGEVYKVAILRLS